MFLKVVRNMRTELYECNSITVDRDETAKLRVALGGGVNCEMAFNLAEEGDCAAWVMNDKGDTVERLFRC